MMVGSAMLYGMEAVTMTKRQESKMEVAEMKMLRFSLGKTRMDKIRDEDIRKTMGMDELGGKLRLLTVSLLNKTVRRQYTQCETLFLRFGNNNIEMRPRSVVDDIIYVNAIFTREQLRRLIDEFHDEVLEHIRSYCIWPELVVHQAYFLVNCQNGIHVAITWCHFAANTLSDGGAAYHPTCENTVSTLINIDQPMIDVEACQPLTILSSPFNCRWTVAFERNVFILASNFG